MSANGTFMATSESGQNPQCVIWNIKEGKRVATLIPHPESVICLAFNSEGTMLATVGLDAHHRLQIVVWDVQLVIIDRIGHNAIPVPSGTNAKGLIMAKQLSDFAVTRICFSPFEEKSLVSCGRENIRFWRIKKGHLPGRPVMLNEYSRGFMFSEIAFDTDPGQHPIDPRKPIAYFASNKGLLLKVDCVKEHVLCAYQLHNGSIASLSIRPGYAVTGGSDSRLRVWPLDYSDFQLEAHHEGTVSNVNASKDGRRLLIGTDAGTLGILDIVEHSYNTISRSHSGSILAVYARGRDSDEVVSLGTDKTIRLWDVMSGQQRFEFTSTNDQPRCAAFDPRGIHILACGFESGFLRIFDVDTTSTLLEQNRHTSAIVALRYGGTLTREGLNVTARSGAGLVGESLILISAALDGVIVTYDALRSFVPLKTASFSDRPVQSVQMAVDFTGTLVAVSGENVGSIAVFNVEELSTVYRNGVVNTNAQNSPRKVPDATGLVVSKTPEGGSSIANVGIFFGEQQGDTLQATPIQDSKAPEPTETAFPAASSTTSSAAGSRSAAPVVGLAFGPPSIASNSHLLVLTDKHVIGLPIHLDEADPNSQTSRLVVKKKSAWDSRCSRRFPYGTAHSMTFDPHTGLFLVAVTAGTSESGSHTLSGLTGSATGTLVAGALTSAAPVESKPDAFVMMGIRVKSSPHSSDRILFSKAQMYREHTGVLNSLCVCGPCGRLVSVDSLGCISIWSMNSINLRLMLNAEITSPSQTVGEDTSGAADGRRTLQEILASSGYPTDISITPVSKNATPRMEIGGVSSRKSTATTASAGAGSGAGSSAVDALTAEDAGDLVGDADVAWVAATKGLTDAFEKVLQNDPAAWSATSQKSAPRPARELQADAPLDDVAVNLNAQNVSRVTFDSDAPLALLPTFAPVSAAVREEMNDSDDEAPEPRGQLENRASLQQLPPAPPVVDHALPLAPPTLPRVTQSLGMYSEILNGDQEVGPSEFYAEGPVKVCSLQQIAEEKQFRNIATQRGLKPATSADCTLLATSYSGM
jgi:WD40 repeat protein